jgi:hypothetical protein
MVYQYKTNISTDDCLYTVDTADSGWPRPSPGPMDYSITRISAYGEMSGRRCSPARPDTDFAASLGELASGE